MKKLDMNERVKAVVALEAEMNEVEAAQLKMAQVIGGLVLDQVLLARKQAALHYAMGKLIKED